MQAGAQDRVAASSAVQTQLRSISVADLDLYTEAGRTAARLRVAQAARQLCARMRDTRRVDDRETYRACQADAIADAMRQIDAPYAGSVPLTAQQR